MERVILRGKMRAVCPDGEDVIVATDAALYRVTRRGHIEPLGPLALDWALDLAVTPTTILWTELTHPMQAAWRRRACAMPRDGGPVRRLTEELSWCRGLLTDGNVVVGILRSKFIRFDRDGNALPDLLESEETYNALTADIRDGRLWWSTDRERCAVSYLRSIALEGGEVRVEAESTEEDLLVPGCKDDYQDSRQLTAVAGGITYEATEAGLIRVTAPSFWDWILGRC